MWGLYGPTLNLLNMETILESVWLQAGAFGVLTTTGWFIWWLERKERLRLQEKIEELLPTITNFMSEQEKTIKDLSEGMAIEELLKKELDRRLN